MTLTEQAIALGWAPDQLDPGSVDVVLFHVDARFLVWARPTRQVPVGTETTTRRGTVLTTLREPTVECVSAANAWQSTHRIRRQVA